MPRDSSDLISELRRDKRFMGTCPTCDEEFRLADALLFSIGDSPPEEVQTATQAMREHIRERKEEIAQAKARMTERAQTTAQAVNLGKIVEKIVPSFESFEYAAEDCRALLEPIDYIVFSGLARRREVDAIHFVDVKSGAARLAPKQKVIKQVVESGKVKFEVAKAGGKK